MQNHWRVQNFIRLLFPKQKGTLQCSQFFGKNCFKLWSHYSGFLNWVYLHHCRGLLLEEFVKSVFGFFYQKGLFTRPISWSSVIWTVTILFYIIVSKLAIFFIIATVLGTYSCQTKLPHLWQLTCPSCIHL